MNTNALKRFAREARIKLLDQVGRKLEFVITNTDQVFLDTYAGQIQSLKDKISAQGKEKVIDTVSYIWFNRLIAFRFMDANGYTTPAVVTPAMGKTPEILQNALAGQLDDTLHLNRQRLNELLDGKATIADAQTEAYKMLLISSCNQWHSTMPFMFERIADYTELLLPDDLLSDYSILSDIRNGMSNYDCENVEIIGWLYQFYISDEKEKLINAKKKYKADELPAVTQLFTPKWIVRYMVDNTLGKYWEENRNNSKISNSLDFYIQSKDEILKNRNGISPIDIKFFDPCVGSAHILCYAFDVFYKIYEEEGYNPSEIPELILANNLFGIDIDERAAQLAAFALIMKARKQNSRIFRKKITPNVICYINVEGDSRFSNAKVLGSLIKVEKEYLDNIIIDSSSIFYEQQMHLKKQATFLSTKYDICVTNPPYISSTKFLPELKTYVEKHFFDFKADLYSVFLKRCSEFVKQDSYYALMTPFTWLYNPTFEKTREFILNDVQICSLIQPEYHSFYDSAHVPICTFVVNVSTGNRTSTFIDLIDFKDKEVQGEKAKEACINVNCNWRYDISVNSLKALPKKIMAFWLSDKMISLFKSNKLLLDYTTPCTGLQTGNNDLFIRKWYEVSNSNIYTKSSPDSRWVKLSKGGNYRKWYGNIDNVLDWMNNGENIKNYEGSVIRNEEYYFKKGISWGRIGVGEFCVRALFDDMIFDQAGDSLFLNNNKYFNYIFSLLNSNVASKIIKSLNRTMNLTSGAIGLLPIVESDDSIKNEVEALLNISISDCRAHEVDFLFEVNEIIRLKSSPNIKDAIGSYKKYWSSKFFEMHKKEEELNKFFINLYGLEDELSPNISLKEISILQPELHRDDLDNIILDRDVLTNKVSSYDLVELPFEDQEILSQFISYAIGCIMGRYSINKSGLILGNQAETLQDFSKQVSDPSFIPDQDNIIPILESEWFNDDIVGRFKIFLKATFGERDFEENLKYIEEIIGKDIRRYLVKDFYSDHIQRYKKRPIYWMFSSPKGHFKALIYMHRYQPDLCSILLTDYLQTFINKLDTARQNQIALGLREDISAREKTAANKEVERLAIMIKDCQEYAQTLYAVATQKITIDLDDGVKVNYQKFKDVLVPIKGLEKEEE